MTNFITPLFHSSRSTLSEASLSESLPAISSSVTKLEAELNLEQWLSLRVSAQGLLLDGLTVGHVLDEDASGDYRYNYQLSFNQGQLTRVTIEALDLEVEQVTSRWTLISKGVNRGIYRQLGQQLSLTYPLDQQGLIHGVVYSLDQANLTFHSFFHGTQVSTLRTRPWDWSLPLDLVSVTDRGFLYLPDPASFQRYSPEYSIFHTNLALTAREREEATNSPLRVTRGFSYSQEGYQLTQSTILPAGWSLQANGRLLIEDARNLHYDGYLDLEQEVAVLFTILERLKGEGYLFNWSPSQEVVDRLYSPTKGWLGITRTN